MTQLIRRALTIGLIASATSTWVAAGEATPGQQVVVTLAVPPYTIGYDVGNSTLYELAPSGTTKVFGSVNPLTGQFTQIPPSSPVDVGSLYISTGVTTNSQTHRLVVLRADGIVTFDTMNHHQTLSPSPSPSPVYNLQQDSVIGEIFSRTPSGVASLAANDDAETTVSPYSFGSAVVAAVSAVDATRHKFYTEEPAASGAMLDAIDETSGSVDHIPLNTPVLALSYNYASETLFGVSQCCSGSLPTQNQVYRIDPLTGTETLIGSVGDASKEFEDVTPSTLDDADLFFTTDGSSTLVSADVSASKSWYVEHIPGQNPAALNTWMMNAGMAEGLRALNANPMSSITLVLDFGPQDRINGVYGANFHGFISDPNIEMAVMNYVSGFNSVVTGKTVAPLTIIVGTSNVLNKAMDNMTSAAGAQWANVVKDTQSRLDIAELLTGITIVGGMDIEMKYSVPNFVATWKQGYGNIVLVDYGNASGCVDGTSECDNSWTKAEIISYSGGVAMPEIYSTGRGNARFWAAVAQYGQAAQTPIVFTNALTQVYACRQRPTDSKCPMTDNSPAAGWLQLTQALKDHAVTAGRLGPSSDIEHRSQSQ